MIAITIITYINIGISINSGSSLITSYFPVIGSYMISLYSHFLSLTFALHICGGLLYVLQTLSNIFLTS